MPMAKDKRLLLKALNTVGNDCTCHKNMQLADKILITTNLSEVI